MKWFEGIEIVLKSKSCHRQYLTIPHTEQNIFLQSVTDMPFLLMDVNDAEDSSTEEASIAQRLNKNESIKELNA